MRKCCVNGCGSTNAILHRFPASKSVCQKWLKCMRDFQPKNSSIKKFCNLFICRKHFEKRFLKTTATMRNRLLMDAYPSLFTEMEISSGVPNLAYEVKENTAPHVELDHKYSRKKHNDHTYCKEGDSPELHSQDCQDTTTATPFEEHFSDHDFDQPLISSDATAATPSEELFSLYLEQPSTPLDTTAATPTKEQFSVYLDQPSISSDTTNATPTKEQFSVYLDPPAISSDPTAATPSEELFSVYSDHPSTSLGTSTATHSEKKFLVYVDQPSTSLDATNVHEVHCTEEQFSVYLDQLKASSDAAPATPSNEQFSVHLDQPSTSLDAAPAAPSKDQISHYLDRPSKSLESSTATSPGDHFLINLDEPPPSLGLETGPTRPTRRRLINNVKNLTPTGKRLHEEYMIARSQVNYLTRLNKSLKFSKEQAFEKLTKNMNPLAKIIMAMQIRLSKKKPRGCRFTLEEKLLALSIMKQSLKCYRFLQRIFILPSQNSLMRTKLETE